MKVLCAGADEDLVMCNTGGDRKSGLHLSDITRRMIWERDRKYNPDSPIDAMVLERGFTWEEALEGALSRRHKRAGYRPEQILEDGIWMSPDWVNPDADVQVEEWKATKKSMKRGFEGIAWNWMPNSMAYLRALLRRGIARTLVVRFRLWWINGDYSYEDKTSDFHLFNEYWKCDVEFSKRELEENWRSILSHGRKYGLLKGETEKWQKTKATTAPVTLRRKSSGSKVPPPSRARARVVTFPTTKRSSKLPNAS